jgi:hypothetical protein
MTTPFRRFAADPAAGIGAAALLIVTCFAQSAVAQQPAPAAPAPVPAPAASEATSQPASVGIVINNQPLNAEQALQLSQQIGQLVAPGHYWYDSASGLWGYQGMPAAGQLPPNLVGVTAPLPANASGGLTNVFINGRSLHPQEVMQLSMLVGQVPPGRYIMNARWQVAYEGGSFAQPLVDLGALAMQAQAMQMQQQMQQQGGTGMRWFGAQNTGNSVYLPELGGRSGGTSVGRASDGCTYVVSGDYSTEVCN